MTGVGFGCGWANLVADERVRLERGDELAELILHIAQQLAPKESGKDSGE